MSVGIAQYIASNCMHKTVYNFTIMIKLIKLVVLNVKTIKVNSMCGNLKTKPSTYNYSMNVLPNAYHKADLYMYDNIHIIVHLHNVMLCTKMK